MTKEGLEKEAEEYAGNTYEMCSYSGLPYASDRRAREQAFLAGAEPREKRIEKLEKENAELKEYNKYLRRKRQGGIQKQYNKVAIIKRQDEQLTKAKELLNEFMRISKASDEDFEHDYSELIGEAEQFLSEVEK